jgi:4a-hydroxytetrahydrobiopterin dehydratase
MNWKTENNKLAKTFKFEDFKSALDFVNKIGEAAEKLNHHPEIYLTWGKVTVYSTTHDEGNKITNKDNELTKAIDDIKI